MSEPDDVERLVAESLTFAEQYRFKDTRETRLARIVRELLAAMPVDECAYGDDPEYGCREGDSPEGMCYPCQFRALRERLCRIARGEEA